jgi:hypothetical protein
MGFNKLFLSEKNLTTIYHKGGALSVFEYLSKYDALLSTDELSTNLIEYTPLPKEELLQKIDELFTITNK